MDRQAGATCIAPARGKHTQAHTGNIKRALRLEQGCPCPPPRNATRCHGYCMAKATAPGHYWGKACATSRPGQRRLPMINEHTSLQAQRHERPHTSIAMRLPRAPHWANHKQDPAANAHQLPTRPCAQNRHHTHTRTTVGRGEGCVLVGVSGTRHEHRHDSRQEKRRWGRVHHASELWRNPARHCLRTFRTEGPPRKCQRGHAPLCAEAQVPKHANGRA